MIDEYQYDQARSRFLGTTWKRGRGVAAACGAVLFFIMQTVMFYVTIGTAGHP